MMTARFASAMACAALIAEAWGQENSDTVTTRLDEVIVTEQRNFLQDTKMGFHSLSASEILRMPVIFGEPDVVKALHALPGVSAGMEGFSGLYVRGGENDQNLFLLDRLPLHNVSHLGGIFSTFNAYSLQKADLYKSAFPAWIGGKVASVTDMQLRRPDFFHTRGTVTLGLISGSAFVTTPLRKGKTALAASLRRTWLDAVTAPALAIINASKKGDGEKTIGGYSFTDASLRLDHIWRSGLTSTLTAFIAHDSFRIGEQRFATDNDDTDDADVYNRKDVTRLKWTTYGAIASLSAAVGKGSLSTDLYLTGSSSRQIETIDFTNSDVDEHSTTSNFNSITETGLNEAWAAPLSEALGLSVGMSQILRRYNPDRRELIRLDKNEAILSSAGRPDRVNAAELSAYGELEWTPSLPFSLTAGLRMQSYLCRGRSRVLWEPRAALQISLSENASLKLGYSRSSQFMQQVSSNYISLPTDSWLPTGSISNPLTADLFSAGAYALTRSGLRLSGEIWYKRMEGLAEFREGVSLANPDVPWQKKVTFGRGWSYGADLTAEKEFGDVSVAVSYGLLWNWRKFAALNGGQRFPAKFDNRHKIDITAGWKIKPDMTLNAQWQYMTGNRTTLALYNVDVPEQFFPGYPTPLPQRPAYGDNIGADYYTGRNNVRLPAFHRLNLSLTVTGKLRKGLRYEWNFGLYNAYWHKNAFSVKKDNILYGDGWNGNGWNRSFKVLSLIPILPSVSYTLKF